MSRIFKKNYDLQGLEISRLAKILLIGKILPVGNLAGGPAARHLLVLSLLHYSGYPIYLLLARFERHLRNLKRFLRKFDWKS